MGFMFHWLQIFRQKPAEQAAYRTANQGKQKQKGQQVIGQSTSDEDRIHHSKLRCITRNCSQDTYANKAYPPSAQTVHTKHEKER